MIPDKTIERLIIYKNFLENLKKEKTAHIYSHDIAEHCDFSSSQVRRDLMVVGYSGNQKKGYEVDKLIFSINELLHPEHFPNMILVGVGNLGKAILHYFSDKLTKYKIVASFDTDKNKIGEFIFCSKCYSMEDMPEIIQKNNVKTAIISVGESSAQEVADILMKNGITGIISFAPKRLKAPDDIFIEYMDFGLVFEKVHYYAKKNIL